MWSFQNFYCSLQSSWLTSITFSGKVEVNYNKFIEQFMIKHKNHKKNFVGLTVMDN